jgi:putative tryptophan/tyrosine transport system substrate-binding protein
MCPPVRRADTQVGPYKCAIIKKRPRRRILVGLLALVIGFAGLVGGVESQQPKKIQRIGFLTPTSLDSYGAFRQSLRDLGYVEGQTLIIEYVKAEGNFTRAQARAAELVRLKVDVIVTTGATDTRAAKETTTTIPIVFLQDPDPVGNGFVTSLARPGGNITGLSTLGADLSGKRLELLKEVLPKLSRLAVLGNSANAGNGIQLRETERAAGAFGMQLQYLDTLSAKDFESAFREASKVRADAVFVLGFPGSLSERTLLGQEAVKNRLPAIYPQINYVEVGGLMSYGTSFADLERRAATYVDKILKGAKPSDLPVEQPKKFEFIVNLKAAKQIGLTIPPNVLSRADKVLR